MRAQLGQRVERRGCARAEGSIRNGSCDRAMRSARLNNADFPLEANGLPSSWGAYRLIRRLFSQPRVEHSIADLAEHSYLASEDVELMCSQLHALDIVHEVKPYSGKYRYNLQSINNELQAKMETALLDFPHRVAKLNLR